MLAAHSVLNHWHTLAFTVLFFIAVLIEVRILHRKHFQRGERKDEQTLRPILIAVFVPIIATYVLAYFGIGQLSFSVGLVLAAAVLLIFGVWLRQYSIYLLGKFFTPVVTVHTDHKLIQDGPYKLLRHPSYTALIVECASLPLALSNWVGMILLLVLLIPALNKRIQTEERALLKQFPKEYPKYMEKSYKLIPYLY